MTLEFQMTGIPGRLLRALARFAALKLGASVAVGWWQRSEIEHALRCLSNRDLADMGIARRDIRELAGASGVTSNEPRNRSATAAMEEFVPTTRTSCGWTEAMAELFSRRLTN